MASMPETPDPALDLGALVGRLRAAGFRVDTRQYLTAHELLLAYAASGVHLAGDVKRLTACLGPIFCTSPDEQERFAAEVREWLDAGREQPSRTPSAAAASATPFALWKRVHWWVGPLVAFLVIAVICGLVGARYYLPVETKGAVQVQLADGQVVPPSEAPGEVTLRADREPLALAPDGTFTVRVARADVVTLEASLKDYPTVTQELRGGAPGGALLTLMPLPTVPEPKAPEQRGVSADPIGVSFSGERTTSRIRWPAVALSALSAALLALAILAAIDRRKRRLALGQLPAHEDPEAITLSVPETPVLPVNETDLRRTSIALRRPRDSAALDLDIDDTVDLTVRNAGFFQPRYSARRAMPEYVVLVSRRTPSDHQARTFDAVLQHLADQDVVLDTYSFVDDPRTCVSSHTGEPFALSRVLERHHRATLIVAAETLCAFNRLTGRLASWVESVRSHERRIFVTPEAPDRWTDRESVLERAGFIVLPATEGGWRVLANVDSTSPADVLFPAPYTRAYPGIIGGEELRWLNRNEPPEAERERLLVELEGYLGPDGFAWLCACAVYPEISWALTLKLAPAGRASALLPSLGRLPWFRHGFMPAWLRRSLVARIPADADARIRTDLERLLEELAGSRSRPQSASLLQIGRWIGPVDLLRAAPAGSPLQDRVFLGFMAGQRDQTWLDAPRALGRLFTERPATISGKPTASSLGAIVRQLAANFRFHAAVNPLARNLAAAAVVGLLSLVPLTWLLTVGEVTGSVQSMWFVEIPEDESAMAAMFDGRAFFMSRSEVTVGQYNACVADNACAPLGPSVRPDGLPDEPDWPVRNVSAREAERFCAWLTTQLSNVANATGPIADALAGGRGGVRWQVTLPTDDKWKWAAFGGRTGAYPWGDDLDDLRANYTRGLEFLPRPVPVGSYPRDMGPFGLVDMAGNVAEWTRRTGQDIRVVVGGSYETTRSQLRAEITTARPAGIDDRAPTVGFRVAIAPMSPPAPASPSGTRPTPAATAEPSPVVPPPPVTEAACTPRTGGPFAPLYFPEGSIQIPAGATSQLTALVAELGRQKGVLTIEGHTSSGANPKNSMSESEQRANAVRSYLVSQGIPASRLRTTPMGDNQPQCSEATAAGRDANRRVEFRFTSGNSAPTIRRIGRSPAGIGLPPTTYTFTAEGVNDPDGDQLKYEWTVPGYPGAPISSTGAAASHLFDIVGSYQVTLTVTDSAGATATASTYVSIGTITGVWDITCSGPPKGEPNFPTAFVATIRQNGNQLTGTIEAGGLSQTFPAPASLENTISAGRRVSFGVESAYNRWSDSDFYFSATVDDQLETMTGTSQYCQSIRGVRRGMARASKK
jgi:outer membrane protein OmpA-like peptidoglycan-associated protein